MNTLNLSNMSLLKAHKWFTTVWLPHLGFSPLQFHCVLVIFFFLTSFVVLSCKAEFPLGSECLICSGDLSQLWCCCSCTSSTQVQEHFCNHSLDSVDCPHLSVPAEIAPAQGISSESPSSLIFSPDITHPRFWLVPHLNFIFIVLSLIRFLCSNSRFDVSNLMCAINSFLKSFFLLTFIIPVWERGFCFQTIFVKNLLNRESVFVRIWHSCVVSGPSVLHPQGPFSRDEMGFESLPFLTISGEIKTCSFTAVLRGVLFLSFQILQRKSVMDFHCHLKRI